MDGNKNAVELTTIEESTTRCWPCPDCQKHTRTFRIRNISTTHLILLYYPTIPPRNSPSHTYPYTGTSTAHAPPHSSNPPSVNASSVRAPSRMRAKALNSSRTRVPRTTEWILLNLVSISVPNDFSLGFVVLLRFRIISFHDLLCSVFRWPARHPLLPNTSFLIRWLVCVGEMTWWTETILGCLFQPSPSLIFFVVTHPWYAGRRNHHHSSHYSINWEAETCYTVKCTS